MATVMVTTRLSPGLARALDQLADHLGWSLGAVTEALLRKSEALREEILKVSVSGPYAEKRNLRLSPQALEYLRRLAGERVEPSVFVRLMLGYFLSNPEALQSVFPQALGKGKAALLPEGDAGPAVVIPVPVGAPLWVQILILFAVLVGPIILAVIIGFLNPPASPPAGPSTGQPKNPAGGENPGSQGSPGPEGERETPQ